MKSTGMWCVAMGATLGLACAGVALAQQPVETEWTYLGTEWPTIESIAVSPVDPDRMLARLSRFASMPSTHSVWQSTDGGERWSALPDIDGRYHGHVGFTEDGRPLIAADNSLWMGWPDQDVYDFRWPWDAPALQLDRMAVGAGDVVYLSAQPAEDGNAPWNVVAYDLVADVVHDRSLPAPAGNSSIDLLEAGGAEQPGLVVAISSNGFIQDPDARLFVSLDGGQSWTSREVAHPQEQVVALDLSSPVWLAASQVGLVYTSADLGQSWQEVPTAGLEILVEAVARHPTLPDTFAVGGWLGAALTHDGGLTWTHIVTNAHVQQLAFTPDGGSILLGLQDDGLYRADAPFEVVRRVGVQLGAMATASIAVNALDANDVAALGRRDLMVQLATSSDGGIEWRQPELSGDAPPALILSRARQTTFGPDGLLYIAGRDPQAGLLRRDANGSWQGLIPGFAAQQFNSDLHSLAFGAEAGHLLVSGRFSVDGSSRNQLRLTTNGGGTWSIPYQSTGLGRDRSDVLNASGPAGTRFLAIFADSVLAPPVLTLSQDGGASWRTVGAGLPDSLRQAQVCSTGSAAPRAFIAGLEDNQPRVFRSDDDGRSWTRTGWGVGQSGGWFGRATALWCDPQRPDVLLMARHGGAVLRSIDGGESFQPLDAGLSEQAITVQALAVSPAEMLYAATDQGVWALPMPDDLPVGPLNLDIANSAGFARPVYQLAWTGGDAQVQVRRNGSVLGVAENTGTFTDRPTPRELPARYQVCNADGGSCTPAQAWRR